MLLSQFHTNKIKITLTEQMGKKMKFPSLFRAADTTTTSSAAATASPWPWPGCVNSPKTLSFRANANANIYKTMNSAYLEEAETPDSFFSIRCGGESFSSSVSDVHEESAVIGALRSDRLFFEPGETSSILEEAKANTLPYNETVKIMAMDSNDPFLDFRASMAEMVEAHGLESWECLEELLTCYLRVNGKSNHGYIVGAFVDLLVHIAMASASSVDDEHCSSTTTTQCSFTSPLSFSSSSTYSSTSPCVSLPDEIAVVKS